jgi:hypothetical protein
MNRSMSLPAALLLLACTTGLARAAGDGADLQKLYGGRDLEALQRTVSAFQLDDAAVSVQEKAKQFKGPDRWRAIFQFVRDGVRTEAYAGSLRGARGCLLSLAGNPIDKAVLLHELLRAAGVPCRYATATAPPSLRAKIIAAMFDPTAAPDARLLRRIPAQAARKPADPAKDPKLAAELATHAWVQARVDGKWIDLDPALPDAKPGAAAVKAARTPPRLPANLRWQLNVSLILHLAEPAGKARTVDALRRSIPVDELVGLPLVLACKPEADAVRPVLLWGRRSADGKPFDAKGPTAGGGRGPGGFPDIFGRVGPPATAKRDARLLAAELRIATTGPGAVPQEVRRFLLDWRFSKPDPAALKGLTRRVTILSVLPGAVRPAALRRSMFMATDGYRSKSPQVRELKGRLAAGDAAAAERIYGKQIAPVLMTGLPWSLQAVAETVCLAADEAAARMNAASCTRTYCRGPRVTLTTWDARGGTLRFDLGLQPQRSVVAPGRPAALADGAQVFASGAALAAESQVGRLAGAKDYHSATSILADGRLAACLPDGSDGTSVSFLVVHARFCAEFLDWPTSVLVAFDSYLLAYAGNLLDMSGSQMEFREMHNWARFMALDLVQNAFVNAAAGGPEGLAQWLVGAGLAEAFLAFAYGSLY